MKKAKRLLALTLAMALVLSFTFVGYAEEYIEPQVLYQNDQYTVTIKQLISGFEYYGKIGNFSEGLAIFQETKDNIIYFGFVDKQGNKTIVSQESNRNTGTNPKHYETYEKDGHIRGHFSNGLLVACRYNEMLGARKYGFLGRDGKEAIPFIYEGAESFIDGYAIVVKDGLYCVIDTTGKVIMEGFDTIANLGSGRFFTREKDANGVSNDSIIDATGKVFYQRPSGITFMSNTLILQASSFESAAGFITVSERTYGYSEGIIPVLVADKDYRFLDLDGKEVGQLATGYNITDGGYYLEHDGFHDGLTVVRGENLKYGFADKTGKIVIEAQYENVGSFYDGRAAVSVSGSSCGYIDKTGKLVIPYSYAFDLNMPERNFYTNGMIFTQSPNDYYGDYYLLNTNGDVLYTLTNGRTSGGGSTINQYDGIRFNDNAVVLRITVKEGTTKNVGTFTTKVDRYDVVVIEIQETKDTKPVVNDTLTAKPTSSRILVNGEQVAFDAYEIAGNNYFKLRDIAYVLNGTEKQFEVSWDGAANAISLTSGLAYTVSGGEMESKGGGVKTPTATSSKILLNGAEVQLTAYTIDGNNYFKLRDLGAAFDFGVDWDGANNTIVIDTSKGYTP